MSVRLYIGNLPKELERKELQDVFAEEGDTVSAKVITDRKTGKCRGFGFVTVQTDEVADQIVEKYNGVMFRENALKIEKALPRKKGKGDGVGEGENGGEDDQPQQQQQPVQQPIKSSGNMPKSGGSGNSKETDDRIARSVAIREAVALHVGLGLSALPYEIVNTAMYFEHYIGTGQNLQSDGANDAAASRKLDSEDLPF